MKHFCVLWGLLLGFVQAQVGSPHHRGLHGEMMLGLDEHEGPACPVCRMSAIDKDEDVDLDWYVEMNHGQRLYTCGMFDGSKTLTSPKEMSHPTKLAASMIEYMEDASKCDLECKECKNNKVALKDPFDGVIVTLENVQYVCLTYGQKLYFSSLENKNKFVKHVAKIPYFLVARSNCKDQECPDFWMTVEKTSSPQLPDEKDRLDDDASQPFCIGSSAMATGFSSSIGSTCVLLLFQPWVLNSATKYVFGLLGTFLAAILNESLVKFRGNLKKSLVARDAVQKQWRYQLGSRAILALLYVIQMTLAYFLMLIVMTYETSLFIVLVLGFGAGHFLLKDFSDDAKMNERSLSRLRRESSWSGVPKHTVSIEGMVCMQNCGRTVQRALLSLPGIISAKVDIDNHQAIIMGEIDDNSIIDAVEGVGFVVVSIKNDSEAMDTPKTIL